MIARILINTLALFQVALLSSAPFMAQVEAQTIIVHEAQTTSGFEHNAPTCDTAGRKHRSGYWESSSESLYPIGASSYSLIPADCVPPRSDVALVGAWYSFSADASAGINAILNSTFYSPNPSTEN